MEKYFCPQGVVGGASYVVTKLITRSSPFFFCFFFFFLTWYPMPTAHNYVVHLMAEEFMIFVELLIP